MMKILRFQKAYGRLSLSLAVPAFRDFSRIERLEPTHIVLIYAGGAGGARPRPLESHCGASIPRRNASGADDTRILYGRRFFSGLAGAALLLWCRSDALQVRRAFTSASSAPAFGYDAYGNALQTTSPVTDFNYAGMFTNADSGLDLTQYRAYDPASGRWLSRDIAGEPFDSSGNTSGNLYTYADNDPINRIDSLGLWTLQIGFSFSYALPGIGIAGNATFGFIVDSSANVAQYGSIGPSASTGIGFWSGIGAAISNAKTICDIGGEFHELGGSYGEGPGYSGNYFWGNSQNGPVRGFGGYFGPGAGLSVSASDTYTWVKPILVWK